MSSWSRPPHCPRRWTLAPVLLLWWLSASAAQAHTQPKPIENWGPFVVDTVPCLRTMSRATHTCFDAVFAAELRCRLLLTHGQECDMAALSSTIDAETGAMRRTLAEECTPGQLTELGYINVFDAQADLFNACALQARWAVTATYAPAKGGTAQPAAADCMDAVAGFARRAMRFALEHETPVIERFATRIYPDAQDKLAIVRRLQTELSDARARWVDGVLAACPDFATIYGRSPASYLRTITDRTDCVLSKTYVNTAVSCLAAVCGNGIQEGDEECDDGNRDDTDGCTSGCLLSQ